MSLKTLFSTTTTAATAAVTGTVKLGSAVGQTTEWLSEWANSLNSEKAKQLRLAEREWELNQRQMELLRQKAEIDVRALKEALDSAKQVDEVLADLWN